MQKKSFASIQKLLQTLNTSSHSVGANFGALLTEPTMTSTMMVMTKESPIRAVKDMQEFTLAEPSDYYTAAAFESLFGDTTAASATLTETWRDETVTAMEVNSAQLAQLLDEDMEHAYLINTAHRIEVDWLYV